MGNANRLAMLRWLNMRATRQYDPYARKSDYRRARRALHALQLPRDWHTSANAARSAHAVMEFGSERGLHPLEDYRV